MSFIKNTRDEMKNVKWPTRSKVITYTIIVVLLSVIVAYLIGGLDYGFSRGVGAVLGSF